MYLARIGFDPRGSATGPLCWIYTPPPTPLSLTPIFPSLFSVEQTETELPLLEQPLPACLMHCGEIMCGSVSPGDCAASFFFFFLFLSSDGGECRGGFVKHRQKQRAGATALACFDTCVCILCTGVRCGIRVRVVARRSMPEDGSEWSGGGDRRCTCCHRAVNSLAEFS